MKLIRGKSGPLRKFTSLSAILIALLKSFFIEANAQELVVNGSFLPPDFAAGWTVVGGYSAISNPNSLESGFYVGQSVSQDLNTIPGQRYLLSFTARGDQWGQSFRMATLQASWN